MRTGRKAFCLLIMFTIVSSLLSADFRENENLRRTRQTLRDLAIPYEERSLLTDFAVPPGSSILVRRDASTSGTFVAAIPIGADFAVDVGLALAEELGNRDSSVNIIIAFLGNEYDGLPGVPGRIAHYGLRDLLTLTDIPENWVLCYVDIAETPQAIRVRHGDRGYIAPRNVLQPLTSLLRDHGIPWSFKVRFNEIYRLGLVEGHEALSLAWAREVNSFALNGVDAIYGDPILPREVARLLLDYAETLDFPMLMVDRHYFFFNTPMGRIVFIGEGIIVALLLSMAGICFFLFLTYSAKNNALLLFHTRLFFRSIWLFFILLALLVVSIMVAGIFYSMLFRLFAPPVSAIPSYAYYAGAGLTLLLAVLVFFLHLPVFTLIRIPNRAQFYGFSSVIFVIMGLFSAAFLDFSFVPAFLWASVFVFLAASLSKPIPVFICVFLIPMFSMGALINIIETGNVILARFLMFPNPRATLSWLGSFLIALFFLPLILLVKRGIILSRKSPLQKRKYRPRLHRRLIVVSSLLAALVLAMLAQILLIPAG